MIVEKLNDDQIEELKMMFPACPNPVNEPQKFMHYIKMYLTSKGLL